MTTATGELTDFFCLPVHVMINDEGVREMIGNIFIDGLGFMPGEMEVCDGRIKKVRILAAEDLQADQRDTYILPGLVDIHSHGCVGCDFSDGDGAGLEKMGRYYAAHGITTFVPASMSLPYKRLEKAFQTAYAYSGRRPEGAARLGGIHMEGPFLSEKKKGAQNGAWLKLPDISEYQRLQDACGHLVKIVDIAPELPGAEAFIKAAAPSCRVSLAHTDASYEQALKAFEAGASHITHLFNGMPPLHHRRPGIVGAAFARENVTVELICDGLHVHPEVVRMVFTLFPGRVCLISDSMRACGMPDGIYELGGQRVIRKGNAARLDDHSLAGAALNLFDDMVNAVHFGVPVIDAVTAATMTPAKAIGMDQEIGSLAAGKRADYIVCDKNFRIRHVAIGDSMI